MIITLENNLVISNGSMNLYKKNDLGGNNNSIPVGEV